MTQEELEASINFIQDFKLTQYMLALASGIVVSLAGALVFMYRDNRTERKEWRADLSIQNERLNNTLEKVASALSGVETSNENLAKLVDRQETTTRRLELLITEKLK
jgi:hypothetical protein